MRAFNTFMKKWVICMGFVAYWPTWIICNSFVSLFVLLFRGFSQQLLQSFDKPISSDVAGRWVVETQFYTWYFLERTDKFFRLSWIPRQALTYLLHQRGEIRNLGYFWRHDRLRNHRGKSCGKFLNMWKGNVLLFKHWFQLSCLYYYIDGVIVALWSLHLSTRRKYASDILQNVTKFWKKYN